MFIITHVSDNGLARTFIGPQALLSSRRVVRDDGVGRTENVLRRSIVLFQQDCGRVWKVALELLDVADRCPSERVDRLIRVSHHA